MNQAILQRTLVEVTDGLAKIPDVRLLHLQPHESAHDSFLVSVEVVGPTASIALQTLAEEVYTKTGTLVLFRKRQSQEG